MTTVNAAGFGQVAQSFRLGMPDIASLRPSVAWKLTDPTNAVYFKPTCVVDWTVNYDKGPTNSVATDCTTGYTSTAFTSIVNGHWAYVSARGVGINNNGGNCSIRIYESHQRTDGTIEATSLMAGVAAPCTYADYAAKRVSLWFK